MLMLTLHTFTASQLHKHSFIVCFGSLCSSGPLVGRRMATQQEHQGHTVPDSEEHSGASSTVSTVSAISRHVHDLQLEVNILGHRCIHLEERLRALEDQQTGVQRRLGWLERVVQQIRSLASQIC